MRDRTRRILESPENSEALTIIADGCSPDKAMLAKDVLRKYSLYLRWETERLRISVMME